MRNLSERQKRIAVINDFSGFGRCSIAVSLPIISSFGIQCSCVPTAIFSNHTGYKNYFFSDFSEHMQKYIENWKALNLSFDGIYVGFLGSASQIDIVKDFIGYFATDKTIVVIDPVMGDHGKFYATYTSEMCKRLKELTPLGNVITPNLTEACFLTDTPYSEKPLNQASLKKMCEKLFVGKTDKIVITGIVKNGVVSNFLWEKGEKPALVTRGHIGPQRAGTGDVFASVLSGALVSGESFSRAVARCADFTSNCAQKSEELNIPTQDGVCFEYFLKDLQV